MPKTYHPKPFLCSLNHATQNHRSLFSEKLGEYSSLPIVAEGRICIGVAGEASARVVSGRSVDILIAVVSQALRLVNLAIVCG